MEPLTDEPAARLATDPFGLRAALDAVYPSGDPALPAYVVRAPGRVNLIGEHTDYNDGFVLPAAISLGISVAYRPTADRIVDLTLLPGGERAAFALDRIGPPSETWIDYVAGVARELARAGLETSGFRGVIAADLPARSGLSSSAALELAAAWALSGGSAPGLPPMDLARAAQRAENEYVGVRCGLMDQFAVTFGEPGAALLLDCRSLEHRAVPLPLSDLTLVVCHSGSPRRLDQVHYNARRAECDRAVATIAAIVPGVASLRDVTPTMLERLRDRLDPVAAARARHVVLENERVLATVAALGAGDLTALGRLFAESHASLRDLFEVSSPELDALVEIAAGVDGVVASRLTGAGFGGCTVNLVRPAAVPAIRAAVEREYRARTGLLPRVFEVDAVRGTGLLAA